MSLILRFLAILAVFAIVGPLAEVVLTPLVQMVRYGYLPPLGDSPLKAIIGIPVVGLFAWVFMVFAWNAGSWFVASLAAAALGATRMRKLFFLIGCIAAGALAMGLIGRHALFPSIQAPVRPLLAVYGAVAGAVCGLICHPLRKAAASPRVTAPGRDG